MLRFCSLVGREARSVVLCAPVWITGAFFVLLNSFAFYLTIAARPAMAVFDQIGLFAVFTSVLLCPIISMRSFAEEYSSGTIETLLTAPIGITQIVLAKFLGNMVFVLLWMIHFVVFALLLWLGGGLDAGVTLSTLLAVFCICALAVSAGIFVSAKASSPAAAAAGTLGILILLAAAGNIDSNSGISKIIFLSGFMPHVHRMISGAIGTDAIFYFVGACSLFLFFARMSLIRSAPKMRILPGCIAVLFIWCNVNWMAVYPWRTFDGSPGSGWLAALQCVTFDVSDDHRNTLLASTGNLLDRLQGRLVFYAFLPEELTIHDIDVAEETRRLLEAFSRNYPLVTIVLSNPSSNPEESSLLAQQFGFTLDDAIGRIVMEYQGRRQILHARTLLTAPDPQALLAGNTDWRYDGESRLSEAIFRIQDPRHPNVFFASGHGELSPDSGRRPERSAARLAVVLTAAGMRVRSFNAAVGLPVPSDCDVLVIAAPNRPWSKQDADIVRKWLAGGGRLFYFAPVAVESSADIKDPLNDLLFDIGGGYRNDILKDLEENHKGEPLMLLGHPKGTDRRRRSGGAFVFPLTRSLRDNPQAIEAGWLCERMVESGDKSESIEQQKNSRQGPFTLLYRSTNNEGQAESRVVVCASGRMASDQGIGLGANEGFIVSLAHWLTGKQGQFLSSGERFIPDRRLKASPALLVFMFWAGSVAQPAMWLLAGAVVWFLRRR